MNPEQMIEEEPMEQDILSSQSGSASSGVQITPLMRRRLKLNKNERNLKKKQMKLDRDQRKERKQRCRELKKQKRGEKRQRKHRLGQEKKLVLNISDTLPADVRKVFLDGNNMMFLTRTLRASATKPQSRSSAEKMLIASLSAFHRDHPTVLQTHLMFDETNASVDADDDGRLFKVSSAKPWKPTSDDLLVELAESEGENAGNCLFVTSDRELIRRLKAKNVLVTRPGKFMKYVFSRCNSDESISSLDQWLSLFQDSETL